MSEGNDVLTKWEELKTLVEMLDNDMRKNAEGNAAAGIRARKGLRLLKNRSAELVKVTVERDRHEAKSEAKPE